MSVALPDGAVGVFRQDLDLFRAYVPALIEHTGHADTLVDYKVGSFAPGIGGTAFDMGCESAELNAIALLTANQTLHQRMTYPPGEGEARIVVCLDNIQLPAIPGATHQNFTAGEQRLAEGQALQVADSFNGANRTHLREVRCTINPAGHHLALGVAQAADSNRLADAQVLGHPSSRRNTYRLSHHT